MATATPPRQIPNRTEAQRRVTHPLQSLSVFIRSYVTIEGILVLLLYLAVCFWIGLAFDYGYFKLAGFLRMTWIDWIEILPYSFRVVMLVGFVLGMLALVGFKVISRLFREFSDPALALVLERRFPTVLGDRLITAIELADPKLAASYGFSQAMIDRTLQDAAEKVETLPVSQVFNWRRLVFLGLLTGVLTVGLYLFIGAIYCLAAWRGPVDYAVRFHHIASIWFERNILLEDSYWPRKAHLEMLEPQFADDSDEPDNLHHNRNEPLPAVKVRAVKWVIAGNSGDKTAQYGWRAMNWRDLDDRLLGAEVPQHAKPSTWAANWAPTWTVDQVDLQLHKADTERTRTDARIYAAVEEVLNGRLSQEKGWQSLKWAELNAERAGVAVSSDRPSVWPAELVGNQEEEGALKPEAVHPSAWPTDWQTRWTLGQVVQTLATPETAQVRHDAAAYEQLLTALDQLAAQADSPWMERRLRKLDLPQNVMLYYKGATIRDDVPMEARENNEFHGTFRNNVRETIRFTVNAADYYTPYKQITLEAPPRLARLTRDEYRPAYIYYRLPERVAPGELRGKRQLFHNLEVSLSDDKPLIQVPAGTSIFLSAETDKDLRQAGITWHYPQEAAEGAAAPGKAKAPKQPAEGGSRPNLPILNNRGFAFSFENVTRPILVDLEFIDTNRLKARRQIQIQPLPDTPPVVDVQVEVLRKTNQGYLITAWNLIPFSGKVTDDHGIARLQYSLTVTGVRTEGTERHAVFAAVSALQLIPCSPGQQVAAAPYLAWLGQQIGQASKADAEERPPEQLPLATFLEELRNKPAEELPLVIRLPQLLKGPTLTLLADTINDLAAARTNPEQIGEVVGKNQARIGEIHQLLQASRAKFKDENVPDELLNRFDKLVLQGLDLVLKRDLPAVLAHPGRDELDKLLTSLVAVQDALQPDGSRVTGQSRAVAAPGAGQDPLQPRRRNGPITEFKVEYDQNFDPEGPPLHEGFDLKKHLYDLKEKDENKPQPHYRLTLTIVATDNNIENSEGKAGIGKSKETFTFLVVSENDLLNDIGKEEESLRLKLEDAISQLQDVKLKLGQISAELPGVKQNDTINKLRDLSQESKDGVAKSGDKVREVFVDYRKILDELKFARAGQQMIKRIKDGICDPLDGTLEKDGELAQADRALDQLCTALQAANAAANADPKLAEEAQVKVDKLIAQLTKVLDSMKDITTINTLIAQLVKIEKALLIQDEALHKQYREKLKVIMEGASK